jgi:hypothetical protein
MLIVVIVTDNTMLKVCATTAITGMAVQKSHLNASTKSYTQTVYVRTVTSTSTTNRNVRKSSPYNPKV